MRVSKTQTRACLTCRRILCTYFGPNIFNLPGQDQDLALSLRLVDIFTNMEINVIGLFDWQYQVHGGDICHCSSNFAFLYQGKNLFTKKKIYSGW